MTLSRSFGQPVSPEENLLLGCVQAFIQPERTKHLTPLLNTELDWNTVEALAQQHAVLPLVYRSLKAACSEHVPQSFLHDLQLQFQRNAAFSFLLTKRLLELVALFKAHDISVVPFKGPSLAVSAYGNLTLRPFSDLDIFVAKKDVLRSKELLCQHGYNVVYPAKQEQELAWLQSHYHYTLTHEDNTLVVELHWGIAPRFFSYSMSSDDGLWQRARTVTIESQAVPCFSPEDQLLLLAIHGSRHRWERVGWICDIALLVCQQGLNWTELFARARKLGIERMLLLALSLAHHLLEAPLPESLKRQLQTDRHIHDLALAAYSGLFPKADTRPRMTVPVFFWHLQTRWGDKRRLLWHLVRGKLSSID